VKAVWVLFRIRVLEVVRRPSGAFWFFALPLILLGLAAFVFAHGHPFERRPVGIVGDDAVLLRKLEAAPDVRVSPWKSPASAERRLRARALSAVVDVDARTVRVGPRDRLFGLGLARELFASDAVDVVDVAESGYTTFLLPGILGQSIVIAGLFGMGYAMVRYRQSLLLKKLRTTPLAPWKFVLAQVLARLVLVTGQLVLVLGVAHAFLRIPFSLGQDLAVIGIGMLGLVTFLGVGFLLAAFVKTDGLVVDVINAVSIPIALLSEMFFTVHDLPAPLRFVAGNLPSTTLVRVLREVLVYGDTDGVLGSCAVLAAWAVLTFAVAAKTFRF
jgi:ABC-type multidrug transport system permease subunit